MKIHNLYAVKNTPLADQVANGEVTLMGRDEYIQTLIDFLELLPPEMVVERISGDAPPDFFVGPTWCLDKPAVLLALNEEMTRRDAVAGEGVRSSVSLAAYQRATISTHSCAAEVEAWLCRLRSSILPIVLPRKSVVAADLISRKAVTARLALVGLLFPVSGRENRSLECRR